eukprot:Hpha_TRINITY_DN30855_c0_g1::TRINITY_DN30855_c0_g1_i1::g.155531::m.155531
MVAAARGEVSLCVVVCAAVVSAQTPPCPCSIAEKVDVSSAGPASGSYSVPAGTCVLLSIDYPMGEALSWSQSASGFTPQLILAENKRFDGKCWGGLAGKDSFLGTTCQNCKIIDDGLMPLSEQCRPTGERLYLEVFNPGPSTGTWQFSGATFVSPSGGAQCQGMGAGDPNACTAADLPSCSSPSPSDGTGGAVVGKKGSCACTCLEKWTPPNCDKYESPTPA